VKPAAALAIRWLHLPAAYLKKVLCLFYKGWNARWIRDENEGAAELWN